MIVRIVLSVLIFTLIAIEIQLHIIRLISKVIVRLYMVWVFLVVVGILP